MFSEKVYKIDRDTYEDARLVEIDFTRNANELDGSSSPDSMVVVVVWASGKFHLILG